MKTILLIYAIVEAVFLIVLFIGMLSRDPTWPYHYGRLSGNWDEGGKIFFFVSFLASLIMTIIIVKIIIWGKIINAL